MNADNKPQVIEPQKNDDRTGIECILRYDNETGKGDHRHRAGREKRYVFTSVDALVKDFLNDVTRWHNENYG
jgi:hypothetical protein